MRWTRTAGVVVVLMAMATSCGVEFATPPGAGVDAGSGAVASTVDTADPLTSTDDGTVSGSPDDPGSVDDQDPESIPGEEPAPGPTTAPPVVPPPTVPALPATPARGAVQVVDVVDGDTIKIAGGQSVRLIGIDTPERGECGYTEAAVVLASLINGRPVVLVPGARTDTDRYGRLLRYVEVDGVDLNLEMIRSGRAIARYDSRDGYGRHPREDVYVFTDAATPSANNCTPQAGAGGPTGDPASGGGGGTDPRFKNCKLAKAAGYGHYVRGVDPEYHWYNDGDGDGIACE